MRFVEFLGWVYGIVVLRVSRVSFRGRVGLLGFLRGGCLFFGFLFRDGTWFKVGRFRYFWCSGFLLCL